MIHDWRATWSDDSLPIIFAQIATSNGQLHQGPPIDSRQGELREAQAMALSLPHTAMIVTQDLPRPNDDVHYLDKLPVGHRFALAALAQVYGEKIESSGPTYRGLKSENGALRLSFDHAVGLHAKNGALGGFAIAGTDQKWVWGEAKIDGDTVIVTSPLVEKPVAVRYAWTATPCGANLYNEADLPAPCFRTDDWPISTAGRIGLRP
jgi:sialate O-acetylesterase